MSKSQLMQLELSTCQCSGGQQQEGGVVSVDYMQMGNGEREMKTEATRALLNYLLQARCQ